MIPTREQIDAWAQQPCGQVAAWCTDMRTEIDRLNRETSTLKEFNEAALAEQAKLQKDVDAAKSELVRVRRNAEALLLRFDSGGVVHMVECENCAKLRAELKAAEDDAMEESDRADRNAELVAKLRAELDSAKAQRDMLHRRLYPTPCKGCPGCSSYADCPDEIHRLTTALDAAHTDAALARDALNKATACLGCGGTVNDHLAPDQGGCFGNFDIGGVSMVPLVGRNAMRKRAEKAEAALATATTAPSEGEIAAWEKKALSDQWSDVGVHGESECDSFIVYRSEITAAVALMRRAATDPDAKLREFRVWVTEVPRHYIIKASRILDVIDELLAAPAKPAEPAPAPVYSRGRVIAESGEPPTDHISTAPTDDRWELVAKLADVVQHLCITNKQGSHVTAIAAQLRGGK